MVRRKFEPFQKRLHHPDYATVVSETENLESQAADWMRDNQDRYEIVEIRRDRTSLVKSGLVTISISIFYENKT